MLVKLLLMRGKMPMIPEAQKPFLYKLIEKRLEHCFTYKITDARLLLMMVLICQTPGIAVMYMAYLQYWCKKNFSESIDLDVFCEKIFPWGFPGDDDLHKLWDSQKVEQNGPGSSDNLLDYSMAYQTIQISEIVWDNLPAVE